MFKRACILFVMALVVSSIACAAQPKELTGNDYLAMPKKDRLATVTALINGARQGGVTIKQQPLQYCKKLDAFYAKRAEMKTEPLAVVLKMLIVMEYDWAQKGVDKDAFARQWLGDKLYQDNKARLKKE